MGRFRLSISTLFFLLSLNATAQQATFPNSPKGLCDYLANVGKRGVRANSLVYMRAALHSIGSIPDQPIGNPERDSAGELKKLGFANLYEMNNEILQDEKKIPDGSVIVLKKGPGCTPAPGINISDDIGHIIVKCGPNLVLWHPNQPMRDIASLLKTDGNRKCVTGVMYNPKWDQAPNSNSRTVTADGGGQAVHN